MTYENLRAYLDQLRIDPIFDPSFNQLIDLAEVSAMELNYGGVRDIRDRDPFSAGSRRAVFAPTDVAYGLSRMYEALKGGGFTVFRDREPARAWLGLESIEGAKGSSH